MSDHIDDSTTDAEIEATVMRDRIRELEARNEELAGAIGEQVAVEDLAQHLAERIAKAKAILEHLTIAEWRVQVRDAIDALEGK